MVAVPVIVVHPVMLPVPQVMHAAVPGCLELWLNTALLGATEAVTIGAAGLVLLQDQQITAMASVAVSVVTVHSARVPLRLRCR